MVRTKSSDREKGKPRGAPFPKGHKGFTKAARRGKPESEVLASPGHEISVDGAVIAPESNKEIVGHLNKEIKPMQAPTSPVSEQKIIAPFSDEHRKEEANLGCDEPGTEVVFSGMKSIEQIMPDVGNTNVTESPSSKEQEPIEEKVMEELTFTNGNNKLTIVLKKKHNRMYRIQMYLNEKVEIRPTTYPGASTAQTVWEFLKGALNK